jgi:hypothetical protein
MKKFIHKILCKINLHIWRVPKKMLFAPKYSSKYYSAQYECLYCKKLIFKP